MPKPKSGVPIRVGDESSGWVHEAPKDGQGAVGTIVKALGCSWEEASKKLGDAYGDVNAVLAGVRATTRAESSRFFSAKHNAN